jgi:glutathione S-transferase
VILYTCGQKTAGPGFLHPCSKAASALKDSGYEFELKTVPGYRLAFWGDRERDRAEIKKLSGQTGVPILVLDDGEVISGSGKIADWAKEHPHSPAKSGG